MYYICNFDIGLRCSVSVTDPASCSSGDTHGDLPAVLPGLLAADPLGHLVADLAVLGHLLALLVRGGPMVDVAVADVVGGVVTLLPVVHHLLAVLPVDLLAVGLVHLVTLLPVAGLVDGVVLQAAPRLLLVLPVAVVVAHHAGGQAQDNLKTYVNYVINTRDTHENEERLHDTAAGRLLSRTEELSSHHQYLYWTLAGTDI